MPTSAPPEVLLSQSLYPAPIPPLPGHPTRDRFEVVPTEDGRGLGMRSREYFPAGSVVAVLSGVLVNQVGLETIQLTARLHLHDAWFCRYLLHSCAPNLVIDTGTLEARATRDIQAGDFLSIDYAATEDHLSRQFQCRCGAPGCRGWITGRAEAPAGTPVP